MEQSRAAVTGCHMFVSEFVSLSSDLNSGALGTGECSVARRVVARHGARRRTLSSAPKSVFGGRAAIRPVKNQEQAAGIGFAVCRSYFVSRFCPGRQPCRAHQNHYVDLDHFSPTFGRRALTYTLRWVVHPCPLSIIA